MPKNPSRFPLTKGKGFGSEPVSDGASSIFRLRGHRPMLIAYNVTKEEYLFYVAVYRTNGNMLVLGRARGRLRCHGTHPGLHAWILC